MQDVPLLHILSTGSTTLAQSLYPDVKDAFQGYFSMLTKLSLTA
jgi:hypothetical protein